ncbi:MAG TPA: hypothetical protein VHD56_14280 [Tepidisphaeraceae bacterium]|nr:hypothetical protein [Tepidisphaeraceae bacterium]
MNVVNLGVLAGLNDSTLAVWVMLLLFGAAILMLLALARTGGRFFAQPRPQPVLVTLTRARIAAIARREQLLRACGTSRAPPCITSRIQGVSRDADRFHR